MCGGGFARPGIRLYNLRWSYPPLSGTGANGLSFGGGHVYHNQVEYGLDLELDFHDTLEDRILSRPT